MSRHPVAWLPVEEDWESALQFAGTQADHSAGHVVSHKEARVLMVAELSNVGTEQLPAVLIQSSLGIALAAAVRLDANIRTQLGRSAVAVALLEEHGMPWSPTLGLAVGVKPALSKMRGAYIGWALVNDPPRIGQNNVVEMILQ